MIPGIGNASAAMAAQFERFSRSAARVSAGAPNTDLVAETVEQIAARTTVEATAAVIRTADQMTGELINIWA